MDMMVTSQLQQSSKSQQSQILFVKDAQGQTLGILGEVKHKVLTWNIFFLFKFLIDYLHLIDQSLSASLFIGETKEIMNRKPFYPFFDSKTWRKKCIDYLKSMLDVSWTDVVRSKRRFIIEDSNGIKYSWSDFSKFLSSDIFDTIPVCTEKCDTSQYGEDDYDAEYEFGERINCVIVNLLNGNWCSCVSILSTLESQKYFEKLNLSKSTCFPDIRHIMDFFHKSCLDKKCIQLFSNGRNGRIDNVVLESTFTCLIKLNNISMVKEFVEKLSLDLNRISFSNFCEFGSWSMIDYVTSKYQLHQYPYIISDSLQYKRLDIVYFMINKMNKINIKFCTEGGVNLLDDYMVNLILFRACSYLSLNQIVILMNDLGVQITYQKLFECALGNDRIDLLSELFKMNRINKTWKINVYSDLKKENIINAVIFLLENGFEVDKYVNLHVYSHGNVDEFKKVHDLNPQMTQSLFEKNEYSMPRDKNILSFLFNTVIFTLGTLERYINRYEFSDIGILRLILYQCDHEMITSYFQEKRSYISHYLRILKKEYDIASENTISSIHS
jgi:hypothetical protein